MSESTDRPRDRAARRGLQSVVQLYLSRPPRRAMEPVKGDEAFEALEPTAPVPAPERARGVAATLEPAGILLRALEVPVAGP